MAFFFEPHLAHVPLRGSSVPCHPSGGAVFFGSYGYSFAGVADMAFDHAVQSAALQLVRAVATPQRLLRRAQRRDHGGRIEYSGGADRAHRDHLPDRDPLHPRIRQ